MQGARLGGLACRVTIRNLRPVEIRTNRSQKDQTQLGNSPFAPLGNGTGVDLAQLRDGSGSTEAVDDLACNEVTLIRFHEVDLSTLNSTNQVYSNESI